MHFIKKNAFNTLRIYNLFIDIATAVYTYGP
ncbi:MAG: hypothetical protein BWY70_01946 [Bacteroidetes bacterium ADurb.Bin408]|nr:MAG: hypothetical protein BWY70_01946 [Bacteroidetes bacterium ADurb.Bin408]